MLPRLDICYLLAAVSFAASANAQEGEGTRKVILDNVAMDLKIAGDDITISYDEPPANLREIGVQNGQVLVSGKWTKREPSVLVGHAYAFAPKCEPISYDIRGVVDANGDLIIMGPTPNLKEGSCEVTSRSWDDQSVMHFMQPPPPKAERTERKKRGKRASSEEEEKPRRRQFREEARPEPKPEPRRRVRTETRPRPARPAQPSYQYPSYPGYYQQPVPWR